jgi:hypothetical protein
MPRVRVAVVLVLAAVLGTGACRTVPVENVTVPLAPPPGVALALNDTAQAIYRGGESVGWRVEEVRPGAMTATLNKRSHVLVVAITHDTSRYTIAYKDSVNLLYDGRQIHRRYKTWIRNLEKAIQKEVATLVKR